MNTNPSKNFFHLWLQSKVLSSTVLDSHEFLSTLPPDQLHNGNPLGFPLQSLLFQALNKNQNPSKIFVSLGPYQKLSIQRLWILLNFSPPSVTTTSNMDSTSASPLEVSFSKVPSISAFIWTLLSIHPGHSEYSPGVLRTFTKTSVAGLNSRRRLDLSH